VFIGVSSGTPLWTIAYCAAMFKVDTSSSRFWTVAIVAGVVATATLGYLLGGGAPDKSRERQRASLNGKKQVRMLVLSKIASCGILSFFAVTN
jgi:hypothetical protein